MGEWWCRGKTDADKQAHSDDCVKKVWMRHSEPECTVARCTNTPPASFEPVPADVAAQKAAKAAVEETPVAPETQACAQTPPPPPATQTPRAKVLPPGWSEAWDETTSQKYYYGGLGETSWDIPTNPATLPPDWKLAPIQPGINKKVYYYNDVTGETSWDHPATLLASLLSPGGNRTSDAPSQMHDVARVAIRRRLQREAALLRYARRQ